MPGRITDDKSAGCHYLIQNHKAILFTNIEQLAVELGWQMPSVKRKVQKELFIQLTEEEQKVVNILKEKDAVHIDEVYLQSGLSSSAAAAAILNLELQNIVLSLPGKVYKLA
jgi:DNA processing protein